jgi:hypothetical protein
LQSNVSREYLEPAAYFVDAEGESGFILQAAVDSIWAAMKARIGVDCLRHYRNFGDA